MTAIERLIYASIWAGVRRDQLLNSLYDRMGRSRKLDHDPLARGLRRTYLKAEHGLAEIALEARSVRTEHSASHVPVQINRAIFQNFMSTARNFDIILLQTEDTVCAEINNPARNRDVRRYARLGGYTYWTAQFRRPDLPKEFEILGKLRLSHYSQALAALGLYVPGTPETLPGYVSS